MMRQGIGGIDLERHIMSQNKYLAPLLAALKDLSAWFKAEKISGVIIGGVAASILGRPRLTRDVDAMVLLDNDAWSGFLNVGKQFGFFPRHPDPIAFAEKKHMILVHHKPSGVDIDISIGMLPFELEVIKNIKWTKISSVKIPLPAPEDLIIMKAVAHRQRDLIDIEAILDAHPKLNLKRIRKWVKEFSYVLEMPEILKDIEKMLKRKKK